MFNERADRDRPTRYSVPESLGFPAGAAVLEHAITTWPFEPQDSLSIEETMASFCGHWEIYQSDNFDEFMVAIGKLLCLLTWYCAKQNIA